MSTSLMMISSVISSRVLNKDPHPQGSIGKSPILMSRSETLTEQIIGVIEMTEQNKKMGSYEIEQSVEQVLNTLKADYQSYDKKADRLEYWLEKLSELENKYSDTEERYDRWVEAYDRVTEQFDDADITRLGLSVHIRRLSRVVEDIATFYVDIRP